MKQNKIKIKPDGKGGWKLLGAPKGASLRRVLLRFPEVESHAGGRTTYHVGGPADVIVRVQYSNGDIKSIRGVEVEW